MKMRIRRIDKDLPLPEYKTAGAAAMDLCVREGAVIPPQGIAVLPLNVCIEPPKGYFVFMAARSSLRKRGLMMANNVGILDEDYAGDGDEYQVALYNFSNEPVEVKRGERVVQIIAFPYERADLLEVESLGNADRGGYGTTGI